MATIAKSIDTGLIIMGGIATSPNGFIMGYLDGPISNLNSACDKLFVAVHTMSWVVFQILALKHGRSKPRWVVVVQLSWIIMNFASVILLHHIFSGGGRGIRLGPSASNNPASNFRDNFNLAFGL